MKLKDYIYRHGIAAYFAVAFSVLSIVLTLILVEVIGLAATEQVKSNIGHSLSELAFQTSDKLDRGMFERYREVELMTRRTDFASDTYTVEEKRKTLEALQETYPHYAWIGMTDNQGKVLVSAKGILEGADVSKRPWFQNAYHGIHHGDVHEALLLAKLLPNPTNEPKRFVDVAFPYADRSGKVLGVLGAHLSWQWAREVEQSIIEPVAQRLKVQAFIVAENGVVLLGPPDTQAKTIDLSRFKTMPGSRNGFTTVTWPDGKQYLVGFSKSEGYLSYPGFGWTVLVRQSVEDAYARVERIQKKVLWSGMAVAALLSLIGLFAARVITRPIWALAHSAQRIEAGDSGELKSTRAVYFEVRALTGSINSLIRNLRQKESDLKELNLNLEKRVEERTEELLKALDAVSENEHRIHTIIETAQDAFVSTDLQGNITDWNSQAEKMFGWRREEVIGRSLAKTVIPERFLPNYERAIKVFYATGEARFINRRLERLLKTRSGHEIAVEATIGLINTNKSCFFGAFLHDISERKKIERMKNEFISTVSHELRTPLTSIRGSLDLLSAGAVGEFPAAAKNLLAIASKSSERLGRMVNDILDIEKIESGGMEFNLVTQALLPLAIQAIEATQSFAANFNVKLVLQPDSADGDVAVDSDRIVQVIVNLLSNAAKFSPTGAEVRIKLERSADHVRLSVTDSGDGIPDEFRGRIFERFAQVDSSDSRKKGGTGLGLNICKSIVEEHGGQIDYHSERGVGTEFYFDLPLAKAKAITAEAAQ